MNRLYNELKRRKVFRVAAIYAGTVWVVAQIVALVLSTYGAPAWVQPTFITLLLAGFPVALVLAWAFELSPDGVKRTRALPEGEGITTSRQTHIMWAGIGVLVFAAAGYWLFFSQGDDSGAPVGGEPVLDQPIVEDRRHWIAVLPLTNMSPHPENAYFAAGIHEEILNQLAKIRDLSIIARTSVLQYENTQKTIPDIAAELGVGTVMEGSVRFANERVRITTQLIDADTNLHIWSETYDRDLQDIFEIQSEVALKVANALHAELSEAETRRIGRVPTRNMAAYSVYLKAVSIWSVQYDFEQVLTLADEAIKLDPDFADAYGMKAVVNLVMMTFPGTSDPSWRREAAYGYAQRALDLDANSAAGHQAMGFYLAGDFKWDEALASFGKSLQINPINQHNRYGYSVLLSALNRHDESIELARESVALNPADEAAHRQLATAYRNAQRFDEAIDTAMASIERFPGHPFPLWNLSWIYRSMGDHDKARQYADQALALAPPFLRHFFLCHVGSSAAYQGDQAKVAEVLNELEVVGQVMWIPPWCMGYIHEGNGDNDAAFAAWEDYLETRDFLFIEWLSNRANSPLRDDPRMNALLERIGLAN